MSEVEELENENAYSLYIGILSLVDEYNDIEDDEVLLGIGMALDWTEDRIAKGLQL